MKITTAFATRLLALCAVLGGLALAGCGGEQKAQPVPVGEMVEYRDPGIGFAIQHPSGWISDAQVGRARFYNAAGVDRKFLEPTGAHPIGVTVTVDVTRSGEPAAALDAFRKELEQTGMQLGQSRQATVAGVAATLIPYTANFGGGNTVTGRHILLTTDSAFYDIGFAGFGSLYEAHAAVFDTVQKSFQLPRPKVKGADETLPSEIFAAHDAGWFSFQYPDNFSLNALPKGKFEQALELRGIRLDCTVRFDVFGAKGLTVEKVFEQNKAAYKGRAAQPVSVGKEGALMVSYPSRADVESRAYFVVKNDKVLRVTMNWYKPQTQQYLAAYEKVIGSIMFK